MKEIIQTLTSRLPKEAVMLVTVIKSSGSTPRKKGARMVVTAAGLQAGTIGGGKVEFLAVSLAKDLLEQKESTQQEYRLTPKEASGLGMVCGGGMTLLYQYLASEDVGLQEIVNAISDCLGTGGSGWLFQPLEETERAPLIFYSEKTGWLGTKEPLVAAFDEQTLAGVAYYVEELTPPSQVYLFGGGHVAQALVPVLANLDFRVTVLDDREAFLNPSYFPEACQLQLVDFADIQQLALTEQDYALVMTRGHLHDLTLHQQLLQTPAYYLGGMGSRHKVAVMKQKLRESGYTEQQIARIHMPIGLAIKAETPAELAISIAGELILARAEQG